MPYLLAALDHSHPQVRRRTVKALGAVRETFAFRQDWLVEGKVPAERRAEMMLYILGVEPQLPAIVQGLLLMHRFERGRATRWCIERALGYGKLHRIPLICYREYLETIRGFQRWDYCSAMADGLLSMNADYETIARDAWRESASGLKAQCLLVMVPEEVAANREFVAQRLGSLGLSLAQVTQLLAANGEQVEEVSAQIVRELEGLPPGAKLEEAPYTIIRAVPAGPAVFSLPFSELTTWKAIGRLVGGCAVLEGVVVALSCTGFRWATAPSNGSSTTVVATVIGLCIASVLFGVFVLAATILWCGETLRASLHRMPQPSGPRSPIVPLLRERLGSVEVAELGPGRS